MSNGMSAKDKLGIAIAAMKAGKVLSNTLGTSPTETPDVQNPYEGSTRDKGETDEGGGSEQQYQQSDQPNGGTLGASTGRTARSGSYLKRRQGRQF